ncbi:hypothetical protein Vi05172_g147 [Venturia inaequalis]|nr:hypothetical protein Vi05172_g147 [Venturia inaequalis]
MAAPQSAVDDEIAALSLQLEDLNQGDDDPGGGQNTIHFHPPYLATQFLPVWLLHNLQLMMRSLLYLYNLKTLIRVTMIRAAAKTFVLHTWQLNSFQYGCSTICS